jgi:hypothetical protein
VLSTLTLDVDRKVRSIRGNGEITFVLEGGPERERDSFRDGGWQGELLTVVVQDDALPDRAPAAEVGRERLADAHPRPQARLMQS